MPFTDTHARNRLPVQAGGQLAQAARSDEPRRVMAGDEGSRLVREFMLGLSHDLRTPLGYVKGYATTLLMPGGLRNEKSLRESLARIVEASEDIEALIDKMLDVAQLEAGALKIEPESLPFEPLVQRAVAWARTRSPEHRFQITCDPNLPSAWVDRLSILRVLQNLLDNARKYSPDGGRISVAVLAASGEIRVGVADEGVGIPENERARLFERYYRGDLVRRRHIAGRGLGLAICRGIVDAHGGRIWVESPVPGRRAGAQPGTVVCFTLPAAPTASV